MGSTSDPARKVNHSRLVLNFPGFEKTDSVAQLGRLKHGGTKTGELWGFSLQEENVEAFPDQHHSAALFTANGKNWNSEVRVVQFRWNDIVDKYEDAPFPSGFLRDLGRFLKFFSDGTVSKYQRVSGRYFAFTIFPFLLASIFALVSWWILSSFVDNSLIVLVLTMMATLGLCKWPGNRLYVPLTIADWGFARDMVERTNREIELRFEEFTETVLNEVSVSNHKEIVVVGHSFGAVWAAVALGEALKRQPDLLRGKALSFLALGSSIPKIALASKADFLRESVARVISEESIIWYEVQTKDDLIAFYKSHPFEILNLEEKCDLVIDRIRFSKGMDKKRYRQMRRSFYRTHRQYILYYDKRVSFDFLLRVFGPFSGREMTKLADVTTAIDNNGSVL